MAETQKIPEGPLPLSIPSWYDDFSNPNNVFCLSLLNGLYTNTISPSTAATQLDTWVTQNSESTLQDIRSNSSPTHVEESGSVARKYTPNASGYIDTFFQAFPWVCEVFDPRSEDQDRVIDFLNELLNLEVHEVPDNIPDAADLQNVRTIRIWEKAGYVQGDIFRSYGAKQTVDNPATDRARRSRNFQSALCRITMTGFTDCSFLSGLCSILPAGKKRPAPTHIIQCGVRPADIHLWLESAAQWLGTPEETQWVYRKCCQKDKTDKANPRDVWSLENWVIWKLQFRAYAKDERVIVTGREVAEKALQMMEDAEH